MTDLLKAKVGDTVACHRRIGFERAVLLGKIVAATMTQLSVDFDGDGTAERYVRRNGKLVGSPGWDAPRLSEATPELVAQATEQKRRRDALRALQRWGSFEKMPTDCLVQMAAIAKGFDK